MYIYVYISNNQYISIKVSPLIRSYFAKGAEMSHHSATEILRNTLLQCDPKWFISKITF